MDSRIVARVQILDEADYVLFRANSHGKRMNVSVFPTAKDKQKRRLNSFSPGMVTSLGEAKL